MSRARPPNLPQQPQESSFLKKPDPCHLRSESNWKLHWIPPAPWQMCFPGPKIKKQTSALAGNRSIRFSEWYWRETKALSVSIPIGSRTPWTIWTKSLPMLKGMITRADSFPIGAGMNTETSDLNRLWIMKMRRSTRTGYAKAIITSFPVSGKESALLIRTPIPLGIRLSGSHRWWLPS